MPMLRKNSDALKRGRSVDLRPKIINHRSTRFISHLSCRLFGFQFVQEAALTVYTFEMLAISSLSLLIGHHLFACIFHVYKQVWAYTGVRELFSLMKTFVCSFLFFFTMLYFFV